MPTEFDERLLSLFRCPCCFQSSLIYIPGIGLQCTNADCYGNQHPFPMADAQPLLIDFRDSLFKKENFINNRRGEVVTRKKGGITTVIKRILWGDSPVSKKQVQKLISQLPKTGKPANVLVVGGGSIGLGTEELYNNPAIWVVAFDVYITENTHFVADGHTIPVQTESMDAVIVQAVLEHVLHPAKVVEEIFRVLKPGGIVYAETPFMQQVHEGAYDFTRFTESGHRWLFKNFEALSSGPVRGVGVSLMWSIRYFFSGLFRSQLLGVLISACFFWLRFVEKVIPEQRNIDGGSCFYFLGRRPDPRWSKPPSLLSITEKSKCKLTYQCRNASKCDKHR